MISSRWVVTLVTCSIVIASLAVYKFQQISSAMAEAESYPEPSETVSLVNVEIIRHQPTISLMGEVLVPERITVRNELPGRITSIGAKPGSQVQEGQILFQMDISEELAQQQSAEARLKLAELNFNRMKDLRKRNSVSQSELDNAISEMQVIRSDLAVLKAQINKKTLRAPFAGNIGLFQLEEGSYLEGSTDIAAFVGNQNWLWVEFAVPQFYPLLEADIEIDVRLVAGFSDIQKARVVARDPVASSSTRTHTYRARIEGKPAGFAQNVSVQITLPIAPERRLIELPLESVQFNEQGAFVYRLIQDEPTGGFRANLKPVEVFERSGKKILIESDFVSGDLLAGVGAFKLQPGMLVYPAFDDSVQQSKGNDPNSGWGADKTESPASATQEG